MCLLRPENHPDAGRSHDAGLGTTGAKRASMGQLKGGDPDLGKPSQLAGRRFSDLRPFNLNVKI